MTKWTNERGYYYARCTLNGREVTYVVDASEFGLSGGKLYWVEWGQASPLDAVTSGPDPLPGPEEP